MKVTGGEERRSGWAGMRPSVLLGPCPARCSCGPSRPTAAHHPLSRSTVCQPPFGTYDTDRGVSSCIMWEPRILCSWARVSFRGLPSPGSGAPSILWVASSSRISRSMSSAWRGRGRGRGLHPGPGRGGPSSSEDSQGLSPAESSWVGEGGSCPLSLARCRVSTTMLGRAEVPSSSSDQVGGSTLGRLPPLRIPSGSSGALRRWGAWGSGGWGRRGTSRRSMVEKVRRGSLRKALGRRRLSGEGDALGELVIKVP